MIDKDDIRAAVGSGLISEAQAASLTALAHSRTGARQDLAAGDEPFELFKGFNEIFIVIGLLILATGWSTVTGLNIASSAVGYQGQVVMTAGITAALIWGLSEYFIRRRRMVAPAIALSIFWVGNAAVGLGAHFAQVFMVAQEDFSSLTLPLALTVLSTAVFWFRFRVPFAMALIAVGGFALAVLIGANQAGTPESFSDLFYLSGDGPFAYITLIVGFVVFAAAMFFDMSDPHRVTRRSAQGFWLHVVAAPALVNTIALSLLEQDNTSSQMLLFAILILFALIAIVIDRRSFLIAAIGYTVTLALIVFEGDGAAITILVLGVFLVALGAFWASIRAAVLRLFSGILPLDWLPPSHSNS